jgi:hypothetical protein
MTTRLEKTLKRELLVDGRSFILAISPEVLKLTLKGKRKGLELHWETLVSGDAALAVALNASIGKFTAEPAGGKRAAVPVSKRPKSPSGEKRSQKSRAR